MPKNKSFEDVLRNGNGVDRQEVGGGDGGGDDGAGGTRKMMNDAAQIPAKDEIPIRQTRRRKYGVITTKGAKSKSRGGMGPKTGSVSSQMDIQKFFLPIRRPGEITTPEGVLRSLFIPEDLNNSLSVSCNDTTKKVFDKGSTKKKI